LGIRLNPLSPPTAPIQEERVAIEEWEIERGL